MQPEHWDQIYKIMNIEPEQAMQMDFTLNALIDSGIMDFKKEISDISGTASGQVSIYSLGGVFQVYSRYYIFLIYPVVPGDLTFNYKPF